MRTVAITLVGAALASSAAAADDVVLRMWSIDKPDGAAPTLAREFSERDNGITIEHREVLFADLANDAMLAFATGNAPDIIAIDNPEHALFASRGALLDLTDRIEASEEMDLSAYFDGPLSSVTWQERIYGLPKESNTIALYYDREAFEAAGLEPPRTWSELEAAARALTDPDGNRYGIAFSAASNEEGTFQFLPWVQMAGGDHDDLAGEGGRAALALWRTLIADGLASPDTLARGQWDSTGTFNAGNAAMAISGPWELGRMVSDADFDWGVTLLPVPEDGRRASAMGGFNWAVFADTEHPDEAFEALEYFRSQDGRLYPEFALLPPRGDVEVVVAPDADPRMAEAIGVFVEQLETARVRGPHPRWPEISAAIQGAVQAVLTGESDIEPALADAQARIDDVLAE